MSDECIHIDAIRDVIPSALGCEECLKIGSPWVHLRLCRTCGHVGCCDDSPNRHATMHFHKSRHPIIEGYDPADPDHRVRHRQSRCASGDWRGGADHRRRSERRGIRKLLATP